MKTDIYVYRKDAKLYGDDEWKECEHDHYISEDIASANFSERLGRMIRYGETLEETSKNTFENEHIKITLR